MAGFVFGLALVRHRQPAAEAARRGEGGRRHHQPARHLLGHLGDVNAATAVVGRGRADPAVRARSRAGAAAGRPGPARPRHRGQQRPGPVRPRRGRRRRGAARSAVRAGARPRRSPTSPRWRPPPAGMVLVIFGESLGAAEAYATKYRYEIDPDQEMIALGARTSGPASWAAWRRAAASRSPRSTRARARARRRRRSSPRCSALVTVVALTPLFKDLPEAVLAALIIHAVSHLWRIGAFRRYWARATGRVLAGHGHARRASSSSTCCRGC